MLTEADLLDLAATDRPITATVTKAEVFTWLDGTPMQRGPGSTETLTASWDDLPPLDPAPIIKGCAFFKEAWLTGGRDFNQPQWMYTTHCATWIEKGKELAHALAKGHPDYTDGSGTDAMWERKLAERAANPKLGWTSCRAIEATGFGGCAGCPHRPLDKSPLNLAEGKAATKLAPPPQGTTFVPAAKTDFYADLPDGYSYHNGVIYAAIASGKKTTDDVPAPVEIPLFNCVIKNAWLEKGADESVANQLHFEFSADVKNAGGRNWRQAKFTWGDLSKPEKVFSSLMDAGVIPNPDGAKILWRFFVSWLTKMQDAKEANETVPYGWYNNTEGFAFDKVLYLNDGTMRPSGVMEDIAGRFTKCGPDDIQDWLDAFETVRSLSCAANMIAVAASFASPIFKFTNESGAVLSIYGRSAAGKTSASRLAMSIWGNPLTCGGRTDATLNSLPDTFGALQNLPFFWDDPQLGDMGKVRTTSFTATNGSTKMRSVVKQNGQVGLAPVKTFCLITTVLTNHSIFDGVSNADRNGDAGPARTLELIAPNIEGDPNAMKGSRASELLDKLKYHYGQMGHVYAKHIAVRTAIIAERMKVWRAFFNEACLLPNGKSSPAERFWQSLCAAIMVAAEEAMMIGVPFELDRMRDFLVQEYKRNQAVVLELNLDNAGGMALDVEGTLTSFITSNNHVTVATDIWRTPPGGKSVAVVNVLKGIQLGVRELCAIQWVRNDRLLRINRKVMFDWCVVQKIGPNAFLDGLKSMFGARVEKRLPMAPRTQWATPQLTCIHIDVQPNSILEPLLDAHISAAVLAEEAAATSRANDNAPVDAHSVPAAGNVA